MAKSGLKNFIEVLEEHKELIRINSFVNPELEITEITDRISKQKGGGKAILFENTGTNFPLLINALGSEKRIALAFGRNSIHDLENEIESLFKDLMSPKDSLWDKLKILPKLKQVSEWMPKKGYGKGICQEIVINKPDLSHIPILKCWPADGGPFITLPGVHTIDPETGAPNLGMYRMQVFDKDLTGMHWHRHKTGANHFKKYKKSGKRMPVSVALGGDLIYTYAASAPMPENMDEYLLAGFLRRKPVRLVKCLTNDLYVPEDADFIIEGYVDPREELIWEGPFGDHTGFYSLADWYPRFHVSCITHRKEAVYPATIVGIPPQEDAYIGLATERIFLTPIRMTMVPELKDMTLPVAGVAHNFTIAKIDKSFPGQAIKVMNSLWGAGQMMFNKVLVVVDETVDIHNPDSVLKAFSDKFNPEYSLHFSKGPLDVLDHSASKFAFGSKLGIDLTTPLPEEEMDKKRPELKQEFEIDNLRRLLEITEAKQLDSISALLLAVRKGKDFKKPAFIDQIKEIEGINTFRFIVIFNHGTDLDDYFTLLWLTGGNLEPDRDVSVIETNGSNIVMVDATFKTEENDNFKRDWPNVVSMNKETISVIDKKWDSLGLGEFIESPSLKFMALIKGNEAVRK